MDGDGKNNKKTLIDEFQDAAGDAYTALPPFEPSEYKQYVEGFDLTEDQKNELLQTLWHIMAMFVNLGWGVDSLPKMLPGLAESSPNCEIQEITETADEFNGAAGSDAPEGEEPL